MENVERKWFLTVLENTYYKHTGRATDFFLGIILSHFWVDCHLEEFTGRR